MPVSKAQPTLTLQPATRITWYFADAASPHPGALCADISYANSVGGTEISTVFLESADRDGTGKVLGTFTPIAPFTAAQAAAQRAHFGAASALVVQAAKQNGYA